MTDPLGADQAAPPRPDRAADLPAATGGRLRVLLVRAFGRHCPYCGGPDIFRGWFALREHCPTCGVRFEREDGYFLGAYAINLLIAEFLGLGTALTIIFGTRFRDASLLWQEALAVSLALGLPLLFFPFSRTLWMALDLLFDPPRARLERRLRGDEIVRETTDLPRRREPR